MAKTSVTNREARRRRLIAQYAERRAVLLKVVQDPSASLEEKQEAYRKIHAMPRDASPVRSRNRCAITGRPRAYYRRFGVSRLVLRRLAHRGELPGVRKASW